MLIGLHGYDLIIDVIMKFLLLLGEIIIIGYFIQQYKQYAYVSKSKLNILFFGVVIYMSSSLINFFQVFITRLNSWLMESIEITLELFGIVLLSRGLFVIMKQLLKASNIDFLTKTYTKRYMDKIFEDTKTLCDKRKDVFSVLFIDIDNFKQINDRFGHEKGNEVLSKIATTLKEAVREGDSVGRYGGDEFIIILNSANQEEAEQVLERCRNSISYNKEFDSYEIGVSGGVSTYPYEGDDIHTLSIIADMKMYKDKEKNKEQEFLVI